MDECNNDNSILNDDVLHIILNRCLNINERISVQTVSKQFNRVVNQSLRSVRVIDRQTIFGKQNATISESGIAKIISECVNANHISLKHITIENSERDGNLFMDAIAKSCPQLQSIDFDSFDCNHNFQQIATNCLNIKKLSSKRINDASLDCIISSPNLESLDMRHNNNMSGLSFSRLGENITEISLNSSETITYTVICQLLPGNGKRIKKLSINLRSNELFPHICSHFTQLTHLDVNFSKNSAVKYDKLSLLTNLTGLSLTVFVDNQLQTIIKTLNGKSIREFEVTFKGSALNFYGSCADNVVSLMCNRFPNLAKLSLKRFWYISDRAMSSIARLGALSSLSLQHCSRISDEGVLQVIESCLLLRHLNLHHCKCVSDAVLHAFIALCEANAYDHSFMLDVRDTRINLIGYNPRDIPRNLLLFTDDNYIKVFR